MAGLIQISSDKLGTWSTFSALVAHPVHGAPMSFRERNKEYLVDHGYTLLGVLPAVVAELRVKDEDLEGDESVFF